MNKEMNKIVKEYMSYVQRYSTSQFQVTLDQYIQLHMLMEQREFYEEVNQKLDDIHKRLKNI